MFLVFCSPATQQVPGFGCVAHWCLGIYNQQQAANKIVVKVQFMRLRNLLQVNPFGQ